MCENTSMHAFRLVRSTERCSSPWERSGVRREMPMTSHSGSREKCFAAAKPTTPISPAIRTFLRSIRHLTLVGGAAVVTAVAVSPFLPFKLFYDEAALALLLQL